MIFLITDHIWKDMDFLSCEDFQDLKHLNAAGRSCDLQTQTFPPWSHFILLVITFSELTFDFSFLKFSEASRICAGDFPCALKAFLYEWGLSRDRGRSYLRKKSWNKLSPARNLSWWNLIRAGRSGTVKAGTVYWVHHTHCEQLWHASHTPWNTLSAACTHKHTLEQVLLVLCTLHAENEERWVEREQNIWLMTY